MGALFESLLSAHYNIAKLRAEAEGRLAHRHEGQHRDRVNFLSWKKEHIDTIGEDGPILGRILSPEHATRVALHDHFEGLLNNRRSKPKTVDEVLEEHRSRHALGAWQHYDWLHHRLRGSTDPAVHEHLQKVTKMLHLDPSPNIKADEAGVEPTLDEIDRAFAEELLPPLAHRLEKRDGRFETFHVKEAQVDAFGVTRFEAELVVFDDEETLGSVATKTDPRAWCEHFPEIFVSTYCIEPSDCKDRRVDPDPWFGNAPINLGQSWNGYLFEHSQLTLGALPIVSGRNILQINFHVDKKQNTVTTTFSMHEPLTSSVLWFLSPGGPDVDRSPSAGIAVKLEEKVPSPPIKTRKKTGKKTVKRVTSTAGKHVRFSPDITFSEELNAVALPLWMVAITDGLFRAAGV